MTIQLSTVEIAPTSSHQYSIIWLHGLAADGHDFEAIVPELTLNKQAHIHFIFPNAPVQAVTINSGMMMPSWYDILEISLNHKVDIDGIYQSQTYIAQLIDQEIDAGIASRNILLAGFSQGGVIALQTGLTFAFELAGIVALSTYLPTLDRINIEGSKQNQNIPIFFGHGSNDPVVDKHAGQEVYQTLKAMNYPVQWHEYPIQHSVCLQEIKAIADFINAIF